MDPHSQRQSISQNLLNTKCFSLKFLLCLGLCLGSFFLYSESTSELENIKKIILSINKDNTLSFTQKGTQTEVIAPRTYKKTISFENDEFSVSYGLDNKTEPILFIQLKSSKLPQTAFEFSGYTLTLTPGSSLTLSLGDSPQTRRVTASHYGYVRLNQELLKPGVATFLSSQKQVLTPLLYNDSSEEKKDSSLSPTHEATPESLLSQNRTSLKTIERRKIQIQTLREVSQSQPITHKEIKPLVKKQEEPSISEIQTQKSPDEEKYLLRENQILVQLCHGLQNILDQITNNPLNADETFQLGLPPLPPLATRPPQASYEFWISQLQSENNALRKKTLETRTNLLNFLTSLPKPSFRLTPLIPEKVQEQTRLATRAYKQQNWDEAILQYEHALKVEPHSLHLLSNLGVVYFSQGNYDAAEKTLLQTVRQAPHDSFSHSILGICYLQQGEIEKAIDSLLISVNLNPSDPQAQNYLAMTLTKKGWLTPAEEHARESIQLNPNYSEAHYNLAQIYANQKPISRELAKKHYNLSVNLGGARDESLETLLQIPPPTAPAATEPQIQVNP
ncbi:MAG: tetratricopeptide repeat protein [Verrucomicrobiota bacterium]